MVGSAVYQTSVLLHTALASLGAVVGEGAVAALYFANRLVQLPLALFGTASAQASLPSLSEQAAHDDLTGFRATLLSVIRMVGFVILPASVGLMVLAFPIVGGLFERGAFDHRSTVMTAQALICYCPGLLAYSISKIFTGAFYALHDTWTPVRLAIEALVMNLLASLLLMWPLQVSGLALAAAITNSVNAYRLTRCLERRLKAPLLSPVRGALGRMLAASVIMAAGCQAVWTAGQFDRHPLIGLPITIALGLLLYGGACAIFRVKELSTALQWASRLPLLQPSASE
jgi:putative peptidoglycan lipid II flippase